MLRTLFPFLGWFNEYKVTDLRSDALAGLTVALVLIPQSMAYAQLAGLPAYYGLYAAFLPPMIASLFGSSRQLATGPVAVVSLMSAASLEPLATAGSAEFITYSVLLAIVVGVFQFLLGVLRLGLVVNFLSHPVVNGFTNAAAIIIASSQFSKFFGVYVDKAPHHYETLIRVFQAALDYTHWPTLLYGIGAVALMATLKKINPRIPNVLIAVAATTLISWATGYNNDRYLSVSSIAMPEFSQKVIYFNKLTAQIDSLGQQRAKCSNQLENLAGDHGNNGDDQTIEKVRLKNAINLLTAEISTTKARQAEARSQLRQLRFAMTQDSQSTTLYLHGHIPEGLKGSGTWRLKVGTNRLDPDALLFRGGGAVVGDIPKGLPRIALPDLTWDNFLTLLPTAIIISLLGFMEAIAIAKAIAAKTGQKLNPNQELIGQGLANIVGSIGSSYAVSGSFSRSAVNLQAGAVSGISSVVTSVMVVITLLYLTPLLFHLPQAVLAAVIMMAVIGLVNVKTFIHAWKAQWYDGAISIITFIATLVSAPHLDKGILIGVTLSMAVFLYKAMRPKVVRLSRDEDSGLRSSERLQLKGCLHIAAIRFDGTLFFANTSYLDEQVSRIRSAMDDLRCLLLDASGINNLDASGEEALDLLVDQIHAAGIGFAMSSIKAPVLEVLRRTGLVNKIGQANIYPDANTAIRDITRTIHVGTDLNPEKCPDCPLAEFIPE
ncbi:MAG: sodium-independent anion transporter [Deltaproteobacteria bacterium]|nr:MAG: sodium-independent anion transporter [Deltaproteobacteria bacterium]